MSEPTENHTPINDIETWDENSVVKYLQKNIKGFDISEVEIIINNKIDGLILLELTKDEMREIGLPYGIIKKIINELDIIKNYNKSASAYRIKQKRNYSSFKKLDEILNKYGINTSEIKLIPNFDIEKTDIKDDDINFTNCLWAVKSRLRCMGDIHVSNEAARKEYISMILFTAANYFKNILIYPEIEINGEDIVGRVDYAIKKIIELSDEELIAVTEGKQTDLKLGIGQNILQLDNATQVNLIFLLYFLRLSLIS